LRIPYNIQLIGEYNMISPKLAILMATMAMIGVGLTGATPLAMAQQSSDGTDGGSIIIVPDVAWIIERNNEIEQSIEQEQEACTNEADVSVSDDDDVIGIGGENEVEVEQSNECEVTQSQSASNNAVIVDESTNIVEIDQQLGPNVPLITCQNVLSFIDPNAIFSGPLEEFFRNCQITNPN
jgi:hypothetical protein